MINVLSFLIVLFNSVIIVFLSFNFSPYPCDSNIYLLLLCVLLVVFSCLHSFNFCFKYFTITNEPSIKYYWLFGDQKKIVKTLDKTLRQNTRKKTRKSTRQKILDFCRSLCLLSSVLFRNSYCFVQEFLVLCLVFLRLSFEL